MGGRILRVISGLRKGHRLKAPKGTDVRPTEDRVKESLFNILGRIDEQALILDGFAGSGSIGIEFLSRGGKLCYFVDKSPESIKAIKDNLTHTKFLDQALVFKKDILQLIKKFGEENIQFDYIYLDPPFNKIDLIRNAFELIRIKNILKADGMIIVEHGKELDLEDELYNFKKKDYRSYGSKIITFYTQ